MSKISTLTICDFKYLQNFENFINSFILNETNQNMYHNHFYIYENEEEIKLFKEKFNYIKNKNIIVHYIKYVIPKVTALENQKKKFFCCHYRFEALKQIIENYNYVMYLDVDSFINKSLYEKCNSINEHFSVFLRENDTKNVSMNKTNTILGKKNIYKNYYNTKKGLTRGFIMAGTFICKNSPEGIELINFLLNKKKLKYKESFTNKQNSIHKKNVYWWTDQIILSEMFYTYTNKIQIYE